MYVEAGPNDEQYVREEIVTALTEIESAIERPIRVLYASCEPNWSPPPWSQAHIRNSGFSTQEGQDKGLTIAHWGSVTNAAVTTMQTMPGQFFNSDPERARDCHLYDYFSPGSAPTAEVWGIEQNGELAQHSGSNHPFVEVADRMLVYYYHFGYIPEVGSLNFDKFFKEPVQLAIDDTFVTNFEERRQERNKQLFEEVASARVGVMRARNRERIQILENDVRSYEQTIRNSLVELQELGHAQDIIDEKMNLANGHWGHQWQKIVDMERVERVDFSGQNVLEVITKPINMTHPTTSEEVYLGIMRFVIKLDTNSIEIHNTDNARRDRAHPHVQNGTPCFGQSQTVISTMITEGQIAALINFLFKFCEQFNPTDDWGRYAAWWYNYNNEAEIPA